MYTSPIGLITTALTEQIEGGIVRAVQEYGIEVDKEGLLRALNYDKAQYERGYAAGYYAGIEEIVRCKDCIHDNTTDCPLCWIENHTLQFINHDAEFFCANGERRSE